jgi:hypothetical protein
VNGIALAALTLVAAQSPTLFGSLAGTWSWVFTGTTGGAVGNIVLITGTQTEGTTAVATRERFTFETPAAFQHTWERLAASGDWQPTSYSQCKLAST